MRANKVVGLTRYTKSLKIWGGPFVDDPSELFLDQYWKISWDQIELDWENVLLRSCCTNVKLTGFKIDKVSRINAWVDKSGRF